MASTIALNLIASLVIVAGLAIVCRWAYLAAGQQARAEVSAPSPVVEQELSRLAA